MHVLSKFEFCISKCCQVALGGTLYPQAFAIDWRDFGSFSAQQSLLPMNLSLLPGKYCMKGEYLFVLGRVRHRLLRLAVPENCGILGM